MLNERLLDRIVWTAMAQTRSAAPYNRPWTPDEDQFLRDHMMEMTDAQLGEQLGRSAIAVHLHWERDLHMPIRSKHPDVVTAQGAAQMLGIDAHKTACWVDMGLLPGRLMPGERKIRLIKRVDFRRWVLNPMNWMYFDRNKVRDPELKRMLKLRAKRWGDEWWSTVQVAKYHGVKTEDVKRYITAGRLPSFRLPVSLGGRHWNRKWSNHFVRKSHALAVTFLKGKGNHMPCKFTPAADAWILKARDELGMTFVAIGRTIMKMGREKISRNGRSHANAMIGYRYHQLKAAQKKSGKHRR